MEPCNRCGTVDPHRMIALMSRWFAAAAELPLDGGYFYLCPACYAERIEADFDAIAERIRAYQKPDRAAIYEAAAHEAAAHEAAAHQAAAAIAAPFAKSPLAAHEAAAEPAAPTPEAPPDPPLT